LSNLDYCPVVWSSAARKDLVKLQLAQNRAACFALNCNQRDDINTMQTSLSWLRVEERLTAPLLLFVRITHVLKIPNCLHSQFTLSSDTHLSHQTCHQWCFHSPQIQNQFKKTYSIIYSPYCMELPSISYCSNKQSGLKKQIKQHLTAQLHSPFSPR
jgi:hypothetical protein